MMQWKKYNGALIPQLPPHVESELDLDFIKKKNKV